jgi:hypothetical protein
MGGKKGPPGAGAVVTRHVDVGPQLANGKEGTGISPDPCALRLLHCLLTELYITVEGARHSMATPCPGRAHEDLMGNCYEWTMTVGVSAMCCVETGRYRQAIVIRGSDRDPDAMHPWAHRVMQIMPGGVLEDTYPPYTSFRVVMDEWQRQQWPGFRVGESQTEVPAQPAFVR